MNRSEYDLPPPSLLTLGLLACERLFHVYRRHDGCNPEGFRELLDDLWQIDLQEETYDDEDVRDTLDFVYDHMHQTRYEAESFPSAVSDILQFIVKLNPYWIFSIEDGLVEAIRYELAERVYLRLEDEMDEDEDEVRDLTPEEEAEIEASPLLRQEFDLRAALREALRAGVDPERLKDIGAGDPLELRTR